MTWPKGGVCRGSNVLDGNVVLVDGVDDSTLCSRLDGIVRINGNCIIGNNSNLTSLACLERSVYPNCSC